MLVRWALIVFLFTEIIAVWLWNDKAIYVGLFIIPAVALYSARLRIIKHAEKVRISFGIQEMLLIPAALVPSFLTVPWALTGQENFDYLMLLLLAYQLSGGLLGWAINFQPSGGWRSALGLFAGALCGAIILALIVVVIGLVMVTLFFYEVKKSGHGIMPFM